MNTLPARPPAAAAAAAPPVHRTPFAKLAAVISWLVFPTLLTAVTAGAIALLGQNLPRPLISGGITLVALGLILGLERLCPLHRSWNARPEPLDLMLLVGNRIIDVIVVAAVIALLQRLERAGMHAALLHVWPARAPLLLQATLGIVLAELVRYVLHRLSHRDGLLGRVHRLHHQPRRMYALNGPRLHPGNYLWIAIANTVPMLLLGAPLSAAVLASIITSFFVLFQHSNVRLRFDGWNRLFATPDVHRLHHLREAAGQPVNYGIVLLGLDVIFGTYQRADRDPGADAIGEAA